MWWIGRKRLQAFDVGFWERDDGLHVQMVSVLLGRESDVLMV